MLAATQRPPSRIRALTITLLLFFTLIQLAYITRLPLVMDEFDGAYEAYRLRHSIPYIHYAPYKTVVGYYVETLPTFFATTVWGRIQAIRIELVLINAAMLAFAAWYLRRLARPLAIAAALALLIVCSTFLERSAELRVDMLTGWAGLVSLLLLLDRRYTPAGALAGMSFLLSQKGAFYLIAGGIALGALLLLERKVRPAALFAATATVVIAAYVALWSLVAPMRTVLSATFLGAVNAAAVPNYEIRARYWSQVLRRDPMVFILAAIAIWLLLRSRDHMRKVAAIYAIVVLAQAIAYPQPWPYFFVLLFPTLFVLHALLFDQWTPKPAIAGLIVLAGIVYPAHRFVVALSRSSAYQRYNVALASAVLRAGDTYLAGTDIIHDREQTIPMLSRLDATMLQAVRQMPPASQQFLIAGLERHPPKVVIGNYRIYNLPLPFREFLVANYARLSGSIWTYAPIAPADGRLTIAFAERYRVESRSAQSVVIDGRKLPNGGDVMLQAGVHRIEATGPVRLRLLPLDAERALDPEFVEEQSFYPRVYDY